MSNVSFRLRPHRDLIVHCVTTLNRPGAVQASTLARSPVKTIMGLL